jgi:4-amino-4-deoxy-L-arabinose transferase-like glycosyltransferase
MKERKENVASSTQEARPFQGARIWLVGILLLHVALSLVYWGRTPYGIPPDEGPHGKYVQHLVETGHLPVFSSADRADYEYHQPPLYYRLGAPFFRLGKALKFSDPASMVRLFSLILGAIAIVLTYLAVAKLFSGRADGQRLAVMSSGFVGLLPMHLMLSSSVSNDMLTEVIFSLTLLVCTAILMDGMTWLRTMVIGCVLGVGLLTKTTCIILFPVVLVAYLLAGRAKKIAWTSVGGHVATALAISLVIGGWWLMRNIRLYGDLLAISQFNKTFQDTAKPDMLIVAFGPLWYLERLVGWTFASFWGVFGHMDTFMPAWAYLIFGVASLSALVRGIPAVRDLMSKAGTVRDVLVIFTLTVGLVGIAFLKFNASFFQVQGRYLYPAILPISVLWSMGISGLFPKKYENLAIYMGIGIPILAQIIALTTCFPIGAT